MGGRNKEGEKLNYLLQIKAFYDRLEINPLDSSAIALWHALMSINNKTAWLSKFTVASSVLCQKSGLKVDNFYKTRNRLQQAGYIEWNSRGGNQAAEYHINVLYGTLSVNNTDTSTDTSADSSTDTSADSSTALTKHKQNTNKKEEEDARAKVLDLWQNLWGFPNAIARQDLDEWMTSLSPDLVQYAIEVAGHHDVQARAADKYVGKVVQGWLDLKITTLKAAQQANTEHEQRLSNQQGYNRFQQPKQRETVPDWGQDDYDASQHHVDVSDAEQAAAQARLDQLRREHEQQGEQQEGAM